MKYRGWGKALAFCILGIVAFNNCTAFKSIKSSGLSLSSLQCTGDESKFARRAWRLTGTQYMNAVKSVFPNVVVGNPFVYDSVPGFYNNNSNGLRLGKAITASLLAENEKVAFAALPSVKQNYTCLNTTLTANCANTVATALGRKAFRRPLSASEVSTYAALLTASVSSYGDGGIAILIQALLTSPNFLFRYEVGNPISGILDNYEKANLISFAAADTAPDDTLMLAAQNNELQTRAQIKQQFLRLARQGGRYNVMIDFFQQYLHYDAITANAKSGELFPNFNAGVAQGLVAETDAFIIDLLNSGNGTLKSFLTSNTVFTQPTTAAIYGREPASLPQNSLTKTTDNARAGILMQPSFISSWGANDRTSPVLVGKAIRTAFLCTKVPEAPPGAPTLDMLDTKQYPTQRQRLAVHNQAACARCHNLMDPIGLGFENFNAIGAFRTTENGYPVDTSGEIMATNSSLDGHFNGGVELSERLANSSVAHNCFMKNSFLYVTGQVDDTGSECFVDLVQKAFQNTQNVDVVEVFADIFAQFVTSPRYGIVEGI